MTRRGYYYLKKQKRTTINSVSSSLLITVLIQILSPQRITRVLFVEGAGIACNATHNPCEELLYKGSTCGPTGYCTNPFSKGCLTTILNEEYGDNELLPSLARRLRNQIRVCNSEDPPESRGVVCMDHQSMATTATGGNKRDGGTSDIYSDYTEIRILSQNWESAFFAGWVMQILLSEILHVPTSMETSKPDTYVNFYSPTNDFMYGGANDWSAIETANSAPFGDCRLLKQQQQQANDEVVDEEEEEEEYVACGHVIPEFWAGTNLKDLWRNHKDGIVDVPEGLGAIAQQGIYVTKFTAEQDPTILNLLGIAGERNRQKLADLFLRPTTWKDYCSEVSKTNCTEPDDVAQRPPQSEAEEIRYHVGGVYTGHFRATDENNCTLNPTTCTGHVSDYPCGWTSYLAAQIYHHNIPLKSSGPEAGSNGYSYGQLVDMYRAANETKSNLMTMWWQPEALYSTFQGTDAEMSKVVLPSPTQECSDNRISGSQRCNYANNEERYGAPEGACDEAPQLLQKVVASSLYKMTFENDAIPVAKQSPAYDAIKAFKINELQLGTILQNWILRGVDTYGFDPRLATCQWVAQNLETIEDFIPRTYPRVAQERDVKSSVLFYVAVSIGGIATIMTAIVTFLTFRRRHGYVMRFSQWEFLLLLLLGLLLVSVGSILLAIPPSDGSCVAIQWLVGVGYTLELVPLIVKVGAMNRLMSAAKRMKRIVLKQKHLFETVAMFMIVIIIYLIVWTAVDAPQRIGEYTLTDDTTEDGEYIVSVGYYCSSNSDIWRYVAVLWHCLLLMFATVLAVQTRNLQKGYSESTVLAIIIYSHFVFVVLRVITFLLGGLLLESQVAGFRSIIYSTDALVTLSVYFIPKLLTDDDKFYALTHGPARKSDGRGSVLTMEGGDEKSGFGRKSFVVFNQESSEMMRSGRSGGSIRAASKPAKSNEFDPDSGFEHENSKEALATGMSLYSHYTNKSSVTKNSKQSKSKDVLENRVSWGGINLTTVLRSSRQSESELNRSACDTIDEEREETVPFQKPVDVLRGSNSWAGAGLTMILRSSASSTVPEEDADGPSGNQLDPIEETATDSSPKPLLPTASLPKEAPVRFNYASSRINKARHMYAPESQQEEVYDDELA